MKVTPKIRSKSRTVNFTSVKEGACFKYEGHLMIKLQPNTTTQQGAVDLETGSLYQEMCGDRVVVVDAQVAWKNIPVKPVKKK